MFVEVGSGERQWNDAAACDAAADAIRQLLESPPLDLPAAIGFGGGHYCRKFSEVTEYALGHICPKHSLGLLDEEMIEQMVEKTVPAPKTALVEKKGLGSEKEKVMKLLEDRSLEIVRV
jgi:D-aminoacyl-tRNA deacylase